MTKNKDNLNKDIEISEKLIFSKIYNIRKQSVMFDFDLAKLYDVSTGNLNQAVRRNINRFPPDFMFQLNYEEFQNLKSQFVISSWGGVRKLPFVFTEQGVAMLSSVLKSKRAVDVNIQIMRIFVKMRLMVISYSELLDKIEKLEANDMKQNHNIEQIYKIIRELISPLYRERKQIGFKINDK